MNLCMIPIRSGSKLIQRQNMKFFNNYIRSLILLFTRHVKKIFIKNIEKSN